MTNLEFKVQGGKLVRDFTRPEPALVEALGRLSTSILSDSLERMNVMHSGLRPVLPGRGFAGPAFTVEEIEAGNLMSHLALKYLKPGDVLVIDGKGVTTRAGWGGLQTLSALRRGTVAVVIDGAVRDVDDIIRLGLPVYCRAVTPSGPHKGWGGRVNMPVSCGGLVVNPGDVVVGDADGIVVVPRAQAATVLEKAHAKARVEEEWFGQVEAGGLTADFLGMEKLARSYGIEGV
jgi:regulator of RNase E activity RraA